MDEAVNSVKSPTTATTVWFMLLYDVVLAAALGQTTRFYTENPTWAIMFFVLICNLFLYLMWMMSSLELISHQSTNPLQKILGLVQILSLTFMAITLGWKSELTYFWGLLAVALSVLALVCLILLGGNKRNSRFLVPLLLLAMLIFLTGSVLSGISILTDQRWIIALFFLGVAVMAVSIFPVVSIRIAQDSRVNTQELQERFGTLLLIVLGEGFVVLVDTLGNIGTIPQPLYFFLLVIVIFSIWLLYYPQLAQFPRPKTVLHSAGRFFAHFALIVCSYNAVAAYASQTLLVASPGESGWGSDDWTSLPLVVVLLAITWLGYLDTLRWSVVQTTHAVSAFFVLLLALLGEDDNSYFGGSSLALSALILLADALVAHYLMNKSQGRAEFNLSPSHVSAD